MYPDRSDGGAIVRDKEDPRYWRVHWLGKIMLPRFASRIVAYVYLSRLQQGKGAD